MKREKKTLITHLLKQYFDIMQRKCSGFRVFSFQVVQLFSVVLFIYTACSKSCCVLDHIHKSAPPKWRAGCGLSWLRESLGDCRMTIKLSTELMGRIEICLDLFTSTILLFIFIFVKIPLSWHKCYRALFRAWFCWYYITYYYLICCPQTLISAHTSLFSVPLSLHKL